MNDNEVRLGRGSLLQLIREARDCIFEGDFERADLLLKDIEEQA